MADSKISLLPSASTLDGTEIVPIVQAGVTKKTTVSALGDRTFNQVLAYGGATGGENIILTNYDVIKSSKVVNPSNFNFGANGDEFQLTNDDSGFAKAWVYGSDNESSLGFADNFIKIKPADASIEHDTLINIKTPRNGFTAEFGNGATMYHDTGTAGEFAKVQSFEGANLIQADVLNRFDAPDNHFPQESANQIVYLNSGNNLKGAGFTPSAVELNTNKGVANGYPSLDSSGLIPASQLPSYIDDVLEFTNLASFPAVGVTGIIYVDKATNLTYRWSGTIYIKLNDGAVTSFNSRTGAILPVSGDYTTALVPDTTNKRYVTDAQLVVIGNTSNTNTGDETNATIISKLGFTPGVGSIKGTISATSGLIPFCNGTADTITTDANFSYTTAGGLKVNNKILGKGLTTQLEPTLPMEMLSGILVRDSATSNSRISGLYISSTEAAFTATYYGGSTYVPMSFYTSDLLRMQIKVNGNITHAKNTYFGNTAIDPTAYVDVNGSSTAFAAMRIRSGSALPTTQLDGEINYVSNRLHHYASGIDNTIAYLSDVSGLTFNASKRLASLMSI